MNSRIKNNQRGIALGPILFIIAVLAILAAAIAAGSGGFTTSTSTESAKAMAEVIINQCGTYQDAMNLMLHNGCDETRIDYTPPAWPAGVGTFIYGDLTAGNGTNRAGNGTCALFDPRGGGMIFKPLPQSAMATTTSGLFASIYGAAAPYIDAFAGYPYLASDTCIINQSGCVSGTNPTVKSALTLMYFYLDYKVCKQINANLNISVDPNATTNSTTNYQYDIFATPYPFRDPGGSPDFGGSPLTSNPNYTEGCAKDQFGSSPYAYAFTCPLMIR